MQANVAPPKVFISYSWSTPEYRDEIVKLAEQLTDNGVHVILDVWDLKAGDDLHHFMEQMVVNKDIKHVLLICDPTYAQKADERSGGVGKETQIVSRAVFERAVQSKFIPVVMRRSADGSAPLPAYLGPRLYIDLSDVGAFSSEFEKLLRMIFERPALSRPVIGKPPAFLDTTASVSTGTRLLLRGIVAGSPPSHTNSNNFPAVLDSLVEDLRQMRTNAFPTVDEGTHVISRIQEMKPLRDAFCDWLRACVRDATDDTLVQCLRSYLEQAIECQEPLDLKAPWANVGNDHIKFFAYETFLYAIAMLISYRRWIPARDLLSFPLCATIRGNFQPTDYGLFNYHINSIEVVWNSKQPRRYKSASAQLVRERADYKSVTFEDLMQVDFLLCLRGLLAPKSSRTSPTWFPRTLFFREAFATSFPLFVRLAVGQETSVCSAFFWHKDWPALKTSIASLTADDLGPYQVHLSFFDPQLAAGARSL